MKTVAEKEQDVKLIYSIMICRKAKNIRMKKSNRHHNLAFTLDITAVKTHFQKPLVIEWFVSVIILEFILGNKQIFHKSSTAHVNAEERRGSRHVPLSK